MAYSDPDRIEREIEEERAQLSDTLRDLEGRFSRERLTNGLSDLISRADTDAVRGLGRTVRENPIPTAMVGAGLAWLAYGAMKSDSEPYLPDEIDDQDHMDPVRADYDFKPVFTAGGLRQTGSQPSGRFDSRVAEADERLRQRAQQDPWGVRQDDLSDRDTEDAGLFHRVRDLGGRGGEAMGNARRTVMSQARRARLRASDLRAKLHDGTEHLTEQARARVVDARTRAYEAQKRAEALAYRGRREASGFVHDHPLAAGVLAAAAGAVVAAALPKTRSETRSLWQTRHALMDAAERIYEEEKERARAAFDAGKKEAGKVAREYTEKATGEREDAPDAETSINRVGDAANKAAND